MEVRTGIALLACLLTWSAAADAATLRPETLDAWRFYVSLTEARIERELASAEGFAVLDFLQASDRASCRPKHASNGVCVMRRATLDEDGNRIPIPHGMVHHWYASVIVPNAAVDDVMSWVQDYDQSAARYEDVEDGRLLERNGNVFDVFLRLRRKKVMTVHYHTEHRVTYRDHGAGRMSSRAVATRIHELEHAGKPNEVEKPLGEDRGFLWGLNSYWRFVEVEGGTLVECESVSLSRTVPQAARWLIKTYLDSVPKESLESTLAPLRDALSR